jgi:hypothetical protein
MNTPTRPRYSIYPVTIKAGDSEIRYYCFQDNDHAGINDSKALYYFGKEKDFFKMKCADDAIRFVTLINSKEGEYLTKI